MQFESAAAERMFLESFHTQRVTQDRIFAVTQAAIALLLALRIPSNAIPAVRLLFWGTHAISASVLGLSSADKASYARLRPYLLSAARVFYNLLCPQLVWQLAAQSSAQGGSRDSWPAFFLLWVTWSRWGSQLLTQVGYLLPFNIEAVLTPFGALLDMLNNQRLCRLLTVVQAQQRPFYRTAFAWLATRLAVPFEMFFATAPRDGCLSADWSAGSGGDTGSSAGSDLAGSACAWNLCTAAVASGRGGSGGGGGDGWQLARRPPQEAFQVAAASKPILLTLVSFAVTRKAYGKITKLFNRDYEAATGRTVRFRLSFGGSGSQARAVIDGMPADVVALALPLDIIKIAEAGLVRDDWAKQFPNDSVVAESVCAIVVRKGNPKNIRGWDDLARDDVSVITANPKTAGVARWIFFALWGVKLGKGKRAATQYVTKVFDQVLVQPRDAREASDVFYRQGMGDVLLTYENEAIFTNLVVPEKDRLPFIVPDQNIRIQCPLALVDYNLANSPSELRHAATAFCNFLYTKEAQREFAACGFRTPYKDLSEEFGLQPVKGLWTVEKRLGGWKAVQTEFFEDTGICSEVLRDVGARKLVARMAK